MTSRTLAEAAARAWVDHFRWKRWLALVDRVQDQGSARSSLELWLMAGAIGDLLGLVKALGNLALYEEGLRDPGSVLSALGVRLPAGVRFRAVLNGPARVHLVLPGPYSEPDDGFAATLDRLAAMPAAAPQSGWEAAGRVVCEAWVDPEARARLHKDPRRALAEGGIEGLGDAEILVVENDARTVHVALWDSSISG